MMAGKTQHGGRSKKLADPYVGKRMGMATERGGTGETGNEE